MLNTEREPILYMYSFEIRPSMKMDYKNARAFCHILFNDILDDELDVVVGGVVFYIHIIVDTNAPNVLLRFTPYKLRPVDSI